MRILITNDDGINAPGLAALEEIAAQVAGDGGEVWTVAPAFEQSGVAHCISYSRPFHVAELAPRRWAAEGSPADCVLAALFEVMAGSPPDLVLSGVNRGNNAAESALYSGTLGAALEAALQGVPAIALSQFYGPGNRDLADPFEAARAHGADLVRRLIPTMTADRTGYGLFHNVNFPPVPAAEVRGAMATPQGRRPGIAMEIAAQDSPSGRRFLWIRSGDQQVASPAGTDAAANLDGWISVVPMRADFTDHAALDAVAGALA
ncbi:5'/3'-nucleotidase SurE [Wenxinia saemankumensis]|uniref:5'-nucleotidase SurE n=1 Tax=Wenxinia saemankumensis TaxID=1447782 RepID=A0A1M6AJC6_9RHOB|nr:5'/3'-nucleotidase SurE [Wenxinia saemankumensis]SHI36600.1 5'-nucleotidase /3'-nucleotidase /exopolyphosphatase [Wenxinia saemankumensis]